MESIDFWDTGTFFYEFRTELGHFFGAYQRPKVSQMDTDAIGTLERQFGPYYRVSHEIGTLLWSSQMESIVLATQLGRWDNNLGRFLEIGTRNWGLRRPERVTAHRFSFWDRHRFGASRISRRSADFWDTSFSSEGGRLDLGHAGWAVEWPRRSETISTTNQLSRTRPIDRRGTPSSSSSSSCVPKSSTASVSQKRVSFGVPSRQVLGWATSEIGTADQRRVSQRKGRPDFASTD